MTPVILGLDISDHAIAAALVGDDATIVAHDRRERTTAAGAADIARLFERHAPSHVAAAVRNPTDVATVDLVSAAAGAVNIADAPRVVTTGAAVVLAEQWAGAARGAEQVVALVAGDHVDAGVLIHGRLFEGARGHAGAAGWLALNPVERDDYRRLGCLEAEIGEPGIVRRMVWRIKAGDRSRVLDLAGGELSGITAPLIFAAAADGDGLALSVVRDTARYIGMAVANVVAMLDPEVVVLGGLIARAGDQLIEPCRAEAARRAPQAVADVRIVPAALGDHAAAIGAARAAMHPR
jgi:predicted NBD/HSP70 family sugar kinase